MKDHEVPVEIDLAYAWQYGLPEHMAGLTELPDRSNAVSSITVFRPEGYCLDGQHPDEMVMDAIVVQVEGTNVRTELTPAAARRMARLLDLLADDIDPNDRDRLEEEDPA